MAWIGSRPMWPRVFTPTWWKSSSRSGRGKIRLSGAAPSGARRGPRWSARSKTSSRSLPETGARSPISPAKRKGALDRASGVVPLVPSRRVTLPSGKAAQRALKDSFLTLRRTPVAVSPHPTLLLMRCSQPCNGCTHNYRVLFGNGRNANRDRVAKGVGMRLLRAPPRLRFELCNLLLFNDLGSTRGMASGCHLRRTEWVAVITPARDQEYWSPRSEP